MSNKFKFLFAKIAIVFLSLIATSAIASNDMNQMLAGMFNNTMSNYTPGGAYMAQSRGVIAGPSLYYRNKASTVSLANFTPPHYAVSCNGIDAYTGSFSFISADKLVNALRAIASNMAPFAFQMAIKAMCQDCDNIMARLQAFANAVNSANINSCQIATKQWGKAEKYLETEFPFLAANKMSKNGTADSPPGGGTGDVQSILSNFTKAADSMLWSNDNAEAVGSESNVAWTVLSKSSLPSWYDPTLVGDSTMANQVIMSLTGTLIKRYENGDDAEKHWKDLPPIPGSVDIQSFINGGSVNILVCDETVRCLNPTLSSSSTALTGFSRLVRAYLFGNSNNGILFKLTSNIKFSTQEQAFIEFAPGAVLTHLKSLAVSPQTASMYADYLVNYISVEMAHHFVSDMIKGLRAQGVAERNDPSIKLWLESLDRLDASIGQQVLISMSRLNGLERSVNVANQLRANLNQQGTVGKAFPTIEKLNLN